jgi:superfamily II DNA/RNA helicase
MYGRNSSRSSFGSRRNNSGVSFGGSSGSKRFSSSKQINNRQRPARRQRGEHIDVSKFILRSIPNDSTNSFKAKNSFSDFGFSTKLKFNIDQRNYASPSAIQDEAIFPIMQGRDLIGLANTGTGKTAAFLLPLINKVYNNRSEKVLIIAPTRELAIQIDKELKTFSLGMNIYSTACVGGMPIGRQIQNLRRGSSFVIGTPGRLKDLSERKLINFDSFKNIVLDEVDRMLDMGFVEEITNILNSLSKQRQTLFFSATLPVKIKNLVNEYLNNPVIIEVKTGDTAARILQDIVRVRDKSEKFEKLQNLLSQPELTKVLIFTETKRDVEKLAVELTSAGHRAESIHGNKRQSQRERSLSAFKNNQCKVLVATDVAARGLDIGDISHVINYTIPNTYDGYCHRIGRTGRGNKSGQALTFVE